MVSWCSGLTCGPVKAEIAGSNPVGTARKNPSFTEGFFYVSQLITLHNDFGTQTPSHLRQVQVFLLIQKEKICVFRVNQRPDFESVR